jgi:hypothetical protein
MTYQLPASKGTSRTASPTGCAPVHSKPRKSCSPPLPPSFFCSSVTQLRGMQLGDTVPTLSNRSAYTKATTPIAPATGQLTHSHR